ncbi:MAG: DUF1501 domain-containing protein [Bacteroidetes bacterium]|nr:MAG: DUF1501 domain-containing protein [Bacteroidota bacterium]
MKRRHFVQYSAAGMLLPSLLNGFSFRALSASPMLRALQSSAIDNDHVLVLVQLGGGNDGLNTVVPLDQYDRLARVRKQVILPENSLLSLDGYDTLSLHPSMTGMRKLFDEGQMQIIQSVGYPNPNYSHFRSTDIWMTGSDSDEVIGSGWAGRYLNYEYPNFPAGYPNATMPDPLSIEIGYSLSLALQGPGTGMGMAISDPTYFYNFINGGQNPTPNTPAGDQLAYIRMITQQAQLYGTAIRGAYNNIDRQGSYPDDNYLAQELKIVARLIAGGLKTRIYLVHLDGFDTHDNQVDAGNHTIGEHANLLKNLSTALSSFMTDLKGLGIDDKVVTVTFSEFGRRIIANNSGGTDHGAAAPMFVIGKNVQGGVLGRNPLIPGNASEDDNIPMQFDFRSVYSTLLKDWFCVPESDLSSVMLKEFPALPIINISDCVSPTIREQNQQAGNLLLVNSPNPFERTTQITFESAGGQTMVQLFNSAGRIVATLHNEMMDAGDYNLNWDSGELPPGVYYCRLQTGSLSQVRALVKTGA